MGGGLGAGRPGLVGSDRIVAYPSPTRLRVQNWVLSGMPVTRPEPMNQAVVHSATLGKLRGGDPTLY